MRPFGSTTSGALSPPLAGKPGLIGVMAPKVAPWSVERWITTLRSPVANAQLPFVAQR